MQTLTQAALELNPGFAQAALSPCCRGCAEFVSSDRTVSVGMCLLHAVRVLAQDKACSHYYQDDKVEPAANDDEF